MKIIDLFFGHKRVVDDNGDFVQHIHRKGAYDAVERSNEKVEERNAAFRLEERPEGEEPSAGSSDHALGEASSEEGQERI